MAIKVDREERPDVDAVYMEATQAMTGQGGWPMTCFLTPDGDPFHCGTYYPAEPARRACRRSPQLLGAVVRAWGEEGERVRDAAALDHPAARVGVPLAAAPPTSTTTPSPGRSWP